MYGCLIRKRESYALWNGMQYSKSILRFLFSDQVISLSHSAHSLPKLLVNTNEVYVHLIGQYVHVIFAYCQKHPDHREWVCRSFIGFPKKSNQGQRFVYMRCLNNSVLKKWPASGAEGIIPPSWYAR